MDQVVRNGSSDAQGHFAALRERLAGSPPDEQPDLLVDLVAEHLPWSWNARADGPRIEAYLAEFGGEFAEFQSAATVPAELVEAEFLARHAAVESGDHPPLDEYRQRFPGRDDVLALLEARGFDGGRYVRIRRVGQGGLGRVWLAWDGHLSRYVALKEPIPGAPNESDLIRRLAAEARITAGLDHAAIVTVHEFRPANGEPPFYVMRWVQGRLLRDAIREYHLSTPNAGDSRVQWNRLLESFVTICDAVAYAHQKGVIHRDLKPNNVVLGDFGGTVLLDWGLAKHVSRKPEQPAQTEHHGPQESENGQGMKANVVCHENSTLTAVDTIVGALPYMAPEQADGRATPASDIFGLGAILYEILAGRPPRQFPNGTPPAKILERIRTSDVSSPRQPRSSVSPALAAVCLKALSRQPEHRYRTATDLAQDVRRWLADEPVSCVPDRWHHRAARLVRRHRRASTAVGVVAFLLIAATAAVAHHESRESRRQARLQELGRLRMTAHSAGWSDEAWNLARQAADIRRDSDVRDEAAATLIGTDAKEIKRFHFGSPPERPTADRRELVEAPFLAFTPDGRRLVMAGSDGRTRVWSVADDVLKTFPTPASGPIAFTEDGSPAQLAPLDPARYQLWDVSAQKPMREFTSPVAGVPNFHPETNPAVTAISPRAEFVAAAVPLPAGQSALMAWNGKTGAVLHQGAPRPRLTALALAAEGGLVAAGDQQGGVTVWSLAGREPLVRLEANNLSINCLAFARDVQKPSPRREDANPMDGWLLAVGDAGGTVTVWDLRRRIPRSYCRGARHDIYAVAFSSDGTALASGGTGPPLLWDVATGAGVCKLEVPVNRVPSIAFSPDGQRLAFGTNRLEPDQPSAVAWDLESGRGIRSLRGLSGTVAKVTFSPNGRYLAALSQSWQVGIWSLEQTRLLHCIEVPPGFFVDNADLAFSRDGSRFVFSAGEWATIWVTRTGEQVQRFKLPQGLQDCLTFDATGKRLLLFRFETEGAKVGPFAAYPWREHPRVCRLRDLLAEEYLKPLWEINDFPVHVYGLRAAGDGKLLVVDGRRVAESNAAPRGKHLMAVYDGTTHKQLWSLPIPDDYNVGRPVLDPLGTVISVETSYALHEAATGRILQSPFRGAGCLTPQGTYHAGSSSEDHGLGLYRTGDNAPLVVMGLDDLVDGCYQIQFSRDGRQVAWPSRDGSIYVADIQEVRRRLASLGMGW